MSSLAKWATVGHMIGNVVAALVGLLVAWEATAFVRRHGWDWWPHLLAAIRTGFRLIRYGVAAPFGRDRYLNFLRVVAGRPVLPPLRPSHDDGDPTPTYYPAAEHEWDTPATRLGPRVAVEDGRRFRDPSGHTWTIRDGVWTRDPQEPSCEWCGVRGAGVDHSRCRSMKVYADARTTIPLCPTHDEAFDNDYQWAITSEHTTPGVNLKAECPQCGKVAQTSGAMLTHRVCVGLACQDCRAGAVAETFEVHSADRAGPVATYTVHNGWDDHLPYRNEPPARDRLLAPDKPRLVGRCDDRGRTYYSQGGPKPIGRFRPVP